MDCGEIFAILFLLPFTGPVIRFPLAAWSVLKIKEKVMREYFFWHAGMVNYDIIARKTVPGTKPFTSACIIARRRS